MRLLPSLAACLLVAASALAGEGRPGHAVEARPGCVAVPQSGIEGGQPVQQAAQRRVVLVCAPVPDSGCAQVEAPSWRFRANGSILPDWRARCFHRADRLPAGSLQARLG